MTQKLFWEDPYLTECTAKVTSIDGKKIKLDRTVFFAFSGGQASDEGTINGIKVIQATKLGDKENIIDIEYELEKEPDFKIGEEVDVKIDSEKRLNLMKLHTAIHLSYYFTIEKYGKLKIIGSNVTEEKARVDYLSEKSLEIEDINEKLNSYLSEGHDIIRYHDETNSDLMWWSCSLGKMPCGGTHVRNTKEIGNVRLKRVTKGAGKERIEAYIL